MVTHAHDLRVYVDDETYADMNDVKALLVRYTKRRVSTRLMIRIALKFMLEGARNGTLQPFLTRVKLETREFENV